MLITAPHVFPIESPPLSPGVIRVEGDVITDIGGESLLQKYQGENIQKLSLTLFPGFVNAHCHLDLTSLNSLPQNTFVEWIKEVVRRKNAMTPGETTAGIKAGIQCLLASGVTTIGDHIGYATDPAPILASPLRSLLFGEVLGLVREVAEDIYHTFQKISSSKLHISPHSVHAVHPGTLEKVFQGPYPLSCHLAESGPEEEYFKDHRGPLADFVRERGLALSHRGKSGLACLQEMGLDISKLLVVHGNYLNDDELDTIAKEKISIVHCPGSHAFFGHRPFPLEKCLKRGINIALGTDSVASNTKLDFLHEMKLMSQAYPSLSTDEILHMATIGGAKALRMEGEIGSLAPGKKADIVGFKTNPPFPPFSKGGFPAKASFVMINGVKVAAENIVTGPEGK
ncbi:MAG: amidohydrolase family protein [Deltaproteobacteria bacterium]|nr:amidohydrolase family protein [Deltaproteobacteria bacterium]